MPKPFGQFVCFHSGTKCTSLRQCELRAVADYMAPQPFAYERLAAALSSLDGDGSTKDLLREAIRRRGRGEGGRFR